MGRRSKIDLLGLVDRVVKLYEQGKTLKEIEAALRAEGYDVSRESIRRKLRSVQEVAEQYRRSLEEARVLLEAVRDNPNTDVTEYTISALGSLLFRYVKGIEDLDFQDPESLIKAVKQLTEAQVKVAGLRLKYQDGFEAAKRAVMEAIAEELKKEPELLQRLREVIERVEAEGQG